MRRERRLDRALLLLAVLVVASTAARFALSRGLAAPWIAPDEQLYGLLGRSLLAGDGLTVLGEPVPFYSLLEHLQLLLDRLRTHYNEERPHQGIANLTPVERYLPRPAPTSRLGELRLAEANSASEYPPHSLLRKVWRNGVVSYDGLAITLGKRYAGAAVRIVEAGELIHVYLGDELIRALAPDRTKRCQKLGKRERRTR